MTTTPTRLVTKVRRSTWVEADHPRDRLGRFIETGAEVRVWGGIGGIVVGNVGGGRLEIARADGSHVIVHRNYLTVVARPDGSAPTDKRDDHPAALPEQAPTPDATELPTPDAPPPVDTGADHGTDLGALLREHNDTALAEQVQTAAKDYVDALGNSTPDDEADERAGLMEVLDQVERTHGDDTQVAAALATLRETATAEPPVTVAERPIILNKPTPPGDVRAQMQRHDDATLRTMAADGNLREVDRQAARDELARREAATADTYAPGDTISYRLRSGVSGSATVRSVNHSDWPIENQTTLFVEYEDGQTGTVDARFVTARTPAGAAAGVDSDTKPVYAGREGGEDHGPDGGTGGAPLQDVPAAGVRDDRGQGSVLPDVGGRGAGADRGPDRRPDRGAEPGRDVPGRAGEAVDRPADGGVAGVPGDAPAGAGADRDTGVRPGDGPDRGGGDRGVPAGAEQPADAVDAGAAQRVADTVRAAFASTNDALASPDATVTRSDRGTETPDGIDVYRVQNGRWVGYAGADAETGEVYETGADRQTVARRAESTRDTMARIRDTPPPAPVDVEAERAAAAERQARRDADAAAAADADAAWQSLRPGDRITVEGRSMIVIGENGAPVWRDGGVVVRGPRGGLRAITPTRGVPPTIVSRGAVWRDEQAPAAPEADQPDGLDALRADAVTPTEQQVWKRHESADYDPAAADVDHWTLNSIIGDRVRMRFFNDHDVAADYETGRVTALNDNGTFEWLPEPLTNPDDSYPIDPDRVHTITRVPEPVDPGQGNLFDQPTDAEVAAATAELRRRLAEPDQPEQIVVEDPVIGVNDDGTLRHASDEGQPAPAPAEPDWQNHWGRLDKAPGSVRTSNGGEITDVLLDSQGRSYSVDVYEPDGTYRTSIPGWRASEVRLDPRPVIPEAAVPSLTDDEHDLPVPEGVDGDLVQPEPDNTEAARIDRIKGARFTPPREENMTPAGRMAKLDANLDALRTLRQLQREDRPATPEEQTTLSRWAGWGGIPEVFDFDRTEFASRRDELLTLLSTSEWNEARRNTLNAHYTDPRVVSALWDTMGDLGFNGGRVLEPGSGSGTFIGLAPAGTDMVGVELDSTTATLSKYLYPQAQVRNESFADTNIPDGSFDATVGNVPFGRFALTDRTHNPDGESIHNHFILKSLALTRPGGLVGVLSSRYTLDSQSDRARRKMYEQADLVGAVRLPTGSHQRASGTDVIEDVLIFRKRMPGETPGDDAWVTSSKRDVDGFDLALSGYFDAHPDHVLGEVTAEKGRFGTGDLIVSGDKDMGTLRTALAQIATSARATGLTGAARPADASPLPEILANDSGRHEGHIQAEPDGTFTQAVGGASRPLPTVPATQAAELTALLGLRDTVQALLAAETASADDTAEITNLRARLNTQYDGYLAKYGPINRYKVTKAGARNRPGQGGFRKDPLYTAVNALETYDPSGEDTWPGGYTGSVTKASIFTTRTVAPRHVRTSADSPADALVLSMDTYGEVNLPAIAGLLGVDEPTAREQMRGLIYEVPALSETDLAAIADAHDARIENPDAPADLDVAESVRTAGRFVPAAEYLSGNVRRKHAAAVAAAEVDSRFAENAAALAEVIPADLGPDEIDGRLGAAWIDARTVEDFLYDLHGMRRSGYNPQIKVVHSGGSIWTVKGPNWGNAATEMWGTGDRSASELVQGMLEQRSIKITRSEKMRDGSRKSYQDLDATLAAQAKAEAIQERFSEWLWEDPERARKLQARYNDQFNAIALRTYDGSGRTFPGMSETFKPHSHVKNAVDRIVNEPTALLAHVVGAGKTAEMVMGTAELRRLGLARKPAIVVPNHMLEQFTREYLEIYPNAKILAAGSADLTGDGRREFVGRAAVGDWDAVILTQGAFESIPMSPDEQQAYIDREMATMRDQLANAENNHDGSQASKQTVKKMENALVRAEEALKKKLDKTKDVGVTFEQTGIDYLMVDEAHMYSNLRTLSNIQGAAATGSDKATDLHMKMEYLRETSRSGRVATFATGTPIRNTVTQAYVMQRFLRPDLLSEAGLHTFDQWAATFGSTVDEMELKPEGTGFRQTTRFAKFRNVPELLRMFHTFADVKLAEDLNLNRPDVAGGGPQTVVVPRTDALAAYIQNLGDRADAVRSGSVEPEEDNMLKISTDGRKAALSMALVGGQHEPGKVETMADRVHAIWDQNKDRLYGNSDLPGAFQMVFLDMGTPKGGKDRSAEASVDDNDADWNGYDTLKSELVARGMPPESIRYIHEAKNDAQKAELFAAARSGRISVLLGSSDKMGVGTNAQTRLVALHHGDAPWRPADVEQRDGRGIRHGNLNPEVSINRYVTEGSFDAYMWQTLERKAKFINQIMRGSLDVREIEDVGDTAMSYAEVKALATGNPDLLEKAKIDTLVQKLSRLDRTHARTQTNLRAEIDRQSHRADFLDAQITTYGDALGKRNLPGASDEHWTMSVDARTFARATDVEGDAEGSARARAGSALRDALLAVREKSRYTWGDGPETSVGTLGGFTVMAQAVTKGEERRVRMWLAGLPGYESTLALNDLREGVGIGLVTRLENAIVGIESRRERAMRDTAEARAEVERMQTRLGATFARAAELDAATRKANRLAAKIDRDAKRAQGADIPYDPAIDSDQYDDPILRTGAQPVEAPVNAPPEEFTPTEVPARTLDAGMRVSFVQREVSGEMGTGTITAVRTAGNYTFVTIMGDNGVEYTRAYEPDTGVLRVGERVDQAKRLVPVLAVIDGQVVVAIERKRFGGTPKFDESEHPRDRMGRFIETGAEVRIWGGGVGKIVSVAGNGRVNVQRSDGSTVQVDAGNVTVTKTPAGIKPPDAPDAPDAPNTPAAPNAPAAPPQVNPDAAPAVLDALDMIDTEDVFDAQDDTSMMDRIRAAVEAGQAPDPNDVALLDGVVRDEIGNRNADRFRQAIDAYSPLDPNAFNPDRTASARLNTALDGIQHRIAYRNADADTAAFDRLLAAVADRRRLDPADVEAAVRGATEGGDARDADFLRQAVASYEPPAPKPKRGLFGRRRGAEATPTPTPAPAAAAPNAPEPIQRPGTTPAPDVTPDGAAAIFEGPNGEHAWLDLSSGSPVGYIQTDPDDPNTIVRYDDSQQWAADVDAAHMDDTTDGGSAASAQQMAADDLAAGQTPATPPASVRAPGAHAATAAPGGAHAGSTSNDIGAIADTVAVDPNNADLADTLRTQASAYDAARASGDKSVLLAAHNSLSTSLHDVERQYGADSVLDEAHQEQIKRARENLVKAIPEFIDPVPEDVVADMAGGSAATFLVKGPDGKYRFTPERAALHQQILESILDGHEPSENPRYHIMGGGPAAGKSTMEKALPEISEGHALLNADEIKAMLPEYGAMTRAGDGRAAGHVHEESSYLAKVVQGEAFNRRLNVTLDGTGNSSPEAVRKKINAARAAGYSVHAYYVTAPTDDAVARAEERGRKTGRYVPESVIRNTHKSVSQTLPEVLDDFDSYVLYDTSGEKGPDGVPRAALILQGGAGQDQNIVDQQKWQQFLDKAGEDPTPKGAAPAPDASAAPAPEISPEVQQARNDAMDELRTQAAALADINLDTAKPTAVNLTGPVEAKLLADLREDGGTGSAHLVENPDGTVTFSPERQDLHRRIVAHFLDGHESVENPWFHVLGGGPAAGKSTMEKALPEIGEGAALLNADEIKGLLPEYLTGLENTDPTAAAVVHGESSYLVKMLQAEAFNRKLNATLDGTGDSSAEKLRAKLQEARDMGYSVHGYYVTAETDEAVRRAQARAAKTGRAVPEKVIRDTHKSVSSIFEDIVGDFDSLVLMDTQAPKGPDGKPGVVMMKEPGGNVQVIDADLYAKFLAKANE